MFQADVTVLCGCCAATQIACRPISARLQPQPKELQFSIVSVLLQGGRTGGGGAVQEGVCKAVTCAAGSAMSLLGGAGGCREAGRAVGSGCMAQTIIAIATAWLAACRRTPRQASWQIFVAASCHVVREALCVAVSCIGACGADWCQWCIAEVLLRPGM